ncbi:MAG: hypothetical protein ACRDGE_07865 [Candidatus Limnocylindria bacterium]
MRGKKDKRRQPPPELPVDLARRIGKAAPEPPGPDAAEPSEPTDQVVVPPEPRPADPGDQRPRMIGVGEPEVAPPASLGPAAPPAGRQAFVTYREPPGPGEQDLVVTPLPTPDDWHRFELALRKVRGVGRIQPEYYRHGVLKLRLSYNGPQRLGQALREMPGYRVRVIGEDRRTLQILVAPETDERRPG